MFQRAWSATEFGRGLTHSERLGRRMPDAALMLPPNAANLYQERA
jgi:hypothetical protein